MKQLKNRLIVISILFFSISTQFILIGQSTFDVIPVTEGQQSQLLDVYTDTNYIYVVGDLMDTTLTPPKQQIVPWWGVFDYNGTLVSKSVISIDSLSNRIGVFGTHLLKKYNGNFIYAPIYYNDDGWAECFVIEIQPSSGKIIRHSIIGNPVDSSSYIIPRWIVLDPFKGGNIVLASNLEVDNIQRNAIFSFDSQLNVIDTILIQDNGRDNYNYFLEVDTDSSYILIGDSRKRNDFSELPDSKPYYMRVNFNGEILTFNLANGIPDKTVGFFLSENSSIKRDVNGNWIFSAVSVFPDEHSFPYVFSYNENFEKMEWAINFSPNINSLDQRHLLYGGDYNKTNRTYVVVGEDLFQHDSYIFKTNEEGDSMWTRHFIPIGWEPDEVGFVNLIDIKATPHNSYVSVGKVAKRPEWVWKSWAILIDSFGCIVPGCENTVGNDEISNVSHELFTIYPNPASTFVGLLCNRELNEELKISVFDSNGRTVKSVNISPKIGYQYILNVSDWIKGMYVLRIESSDGNLLQTTQIVVN